MRHFASGPREFGPKLSLSLVYNPFQVNNRFRLGRPRIRSRNSTQIAEIAWIDGARRKPAWSRCRMRCSLYTLPDSVFDFRHCESRAVHCATQPNVTDLPFPKGSCNNKRGLNNEFSNGAALYLTALVN